MVSTLSEDFFKLYLDDDRTYPQLARESQLVLPYSDDEMMYCLQAYTSLNHDRLVREGVWTDWEEYYGKLKELRLDDKIKYAFDLMIIAEALPLLVNPDPYKITMLTIYEKFVTRWFNRAPDYVNVNQLWGYCQSLAHMIFDKEVEVVEYTPALKAKRFAWRAIEEKAEEAKDNWTKEYFEDPEVRLLRSLCPIRKINDNTYTFVTKGLKNYFDTLNISDALDKMRALST